MIKDPIRLMRLEEYLRSRIKGQEEAVTVIAKAVCRAETGVSRQGRPKGSFLLLGPTGTGKTEITLCMVRFLADTEDPAELDRNFARFDMAEYQEKSAVGRLIGRDRSEQGLLGDAIDRLNANGGGVLLFDEIEKAHEDLSTIFLSAADAARITMSNGQTKRLERIYLNFTSNLGSKEASQMQAAASTLVRKHVLTCAQQYFRPELYARFDEKIVFGRLSYDTQVEIARDILRKELELLCTQKEIHLSAGGSVLHFLIKRGFDRVLGARPMRGAVEKEVGDAWSRFFLGRLSGGESVTAGEHLTLLAESDQLIIQPVSAAASAPMPFSAL